MITDHLSNAHLYTTLSADIQRAFEYLQNTDLQALETGKFDLDGKQLYINSQEYISKLPEQGQWEAHRQYIDLQYLISGTERIGYAPICRLTPGDYNPDKDYQPLSGTGDFITLTAGDFMILFPEEAHMPGIAAGESTPVKKVVVKIHI